MTAITLARAVAPAKSISHTEVFAASSAVNVACLATERLADLAAAGGADIEGGLADLLMHLKAVYAQLDRAMG